MDKKDERIQTTFKIFRLLEAWRVEFSKNKFCVILYKKYEQEKNGIGRVETRQFALFTGKKKFCVCACLKVALISF